MRLVSGRSAVAAIATVAWFCSAASAETPTEGAAPTLADALSRISESQLVANTVWTLIAGMLVFFMNAGFGCLETGLCRRKNAVHILAKNFIVFAVSSVAFWIVGFGLMFGGTRGADGTIEGSKWVGLTGFMPSLLGDGSQFPGLSWATVPESVKFFFQLVFAGTAATIVSGVVAERIKFGSFMLFSFLLVALVYPVTGHWLWGGGWLSGLETAPHDFAGSTVVHSVGGWAALAGVLLLGPRMGKYKDGKVQAIPGHNMGLAAIGTLILWLGWFGFNPGSTMAAVPGIGYIAVTTNMAAACGALFATITAWVVLGKPDLTMILNGCLAGLVAITAPCAVVTVGGAAIIGSIAGILVVLSVLFWDRIRIDDPVGALSVHLVCGIWGTLAVGLFAAPKVLEMGLGVSKPGLFYGGDASQLLAQLLAVGTVGAFVMVASLVLWAALKATVGIRVSPAEEEEGLDIGEHGMEAYPGFGFGADVVSSTTPDLGEVIPATVPGQKRFSVVVEGADPKDLIGAWTQLCGAPAPPPDFKSLYSFVTTVQGNRFRFRGGDPGAMADTLRRLFQSVLKGSSVTAKLEP